MQSLWVRTMCCNHAAMFPNRVRCSKSMNHERDGLHHTPPIGSVCKYVHQLGNQVLLCNVRGGGCTILFYACCCSFVMEMVRKMR